MQAIEEKIIKFNKQGLRFEAKHSRIHSETIKTIEQDETKYLIHLTRCMKAKIYK